jgi:Leucine-rich repeat (LRR) protein
MRACARRWEERYGYSGTLPTEIGDLTALQGLGLLGNVISGQLPTEMGRLVRVERLLLPFNTITGSLPTEVGLLRGLWELVVDENYLDKQLPTELGNISGLETMCARAGTCQIEHLICRRSSGHSRAPALACPHLA